MFCRHCGKEIADDSTFCRYCGKPVEPEDDEGKAAQPVTGPSSAVKRKGQHEGGKPESEKPKKKHRGCLIAVIIVVVLIFAAAASCTNHASSDDTSSSSSATTSTTGSANDDADATSEDEGSHDDGATDTTDATEQSESSSTGAGADDGSGSSGSTLYDINKVDPSVKAFGEEYEEFVDQYVVFMKKYASADSASQVGMLSDYNRLVQQEIEMADRADEINDEEDTFDKDTYQYWIDLYSRCSQKMLEVAN